MNKRTLLSLLAVVMLAGSWTGLSAQDKVVKKIIETGTTDNKTMEHADWLANRIGGRIVGSPALTHAEAWVKEQFESWGLEVMVQEAGEINVGFYRGPWSGRMLSEDGMALHFGTPAYTSGTKGKQAGPVFIEPKNQREFDRMKGALKGSWVLLNKTSNGMAFDWRENSDTLFYRDMVEAGIAGFIRSAKLPLRVMYDRAHCYELTMETLPTVCDIILDEDQFEIIKKKVLRKDLFQLEFDIRNHFYRGPVKYHNIIGILRGSKYPKEYVMAGGHLDSYDIAGGAVDDGNGASVTLEAARLMATSGAKPKRTVLFCIWTAEEFGLLGSKYFVENNTVPLDKISNYINRDGGPLCATSVTVPPAMYEDYVEVCKPILNLNPEFPFTVNKREGDPQPRPTRAGGSDHAYFAKNGVPTLSFRESDPKGYNFEYGEIWHTERDIYNKLIPEYLEHSAVVEAVVLYGLANLDHLLSREGLYSN
ncbi:MAG: M20/M25/M40 family metallo-hydrolase [Bacteroidales bacterium]|jgi:hypothetical protein|nr:M20/M25/M40 family metallo-hydrolase [Bacteroidales bacterium]